MGYYRRWWVRYSIVPRGQTEGEPLEKYFRTHAEMMAWVKRTTADVMSQQQRIFLVLDKL